MQDHCSPTLIHSSFSHLWNQLTHPLQSHSSFLVFKTPVHSVSDRPKFQNDAVSHRSPHPWPHPTAILPPSKFPVFPPWSLLLYPTCPPYATSSASHSSPHPLLVHVSLYLGLILCCWCSPPHPSLNCSFAPLLCPDLFSVLTLSQPSTFHLSVQILYESKDLYRLYGILVSLVGSCPWIGPIKEDLFNC